MNIIKKLVFTLAALMLITANAGAISIKEVVKVSKYKQWQIGAYTPGGYIYTKRSWKKPNGKYNYNIKGIVKRRFFQYERQGAGRGINLGWTDNASAKTARKRAQWFFTRKSNVKSALRYGERVAIAWGKKSSYIKYAKRRVGINLNWSKKPRYEWVILGGKIGTPVRRGRGWVIIYNVRNRQPLIYFRRTVGAHIGWPNSNTWSGAAKKKAKNAAKATGRAVVWTARELKKELERMFLICKGDLVCQSKIKLYQGYMIQLRTGTRMYKLPATYSRLLNRYYRALKHLRRYRFGYASRQPKENATTDCSKTYYRNKKYVRLLRLAKLPRKRFWWLLHELEHYNQCKRRGGRSRYALMWFGDLKMGLLKGRNMKAIHDAMPMEIRAIKRANVICRKLRGCLIPKKYRKM